MTEVAIQLSGQLLGLSENDRLELARMLWNSVDDEALIDADDEFDVELERRFAEIESGQAVGEPARKVIEELREKYK